MNKMKSNVKLMSLIRTKLLSLVFLSKFFFRYYDGRNFILCKREVKTEFGSQKDIHLLGSFCLTQNCI